MGDPARAGAWATALIGLAASVAGNVGHVAGADAASMMTTAVPPLAAFAVMWLGMTVLKRVTSSQVVVAADHSSITADHPETIPVPAGTTVAVTVHDAASAAYAASAECGKPISERRLASQFGLPRSQVRKLRAEVVRAPAETPA